MLRLVGIIVLALVALMSCIAGGYHWWAGRKIQHRLAVLRAAHQPLTLVELNAYYPEVPAASNAAPAYHRAFEALSKSKSSPFLEHLDELPSGSKVLPEDLQQSMQAVCQENAAAFEALGQAAKLRLCRYPVDYRPGWGTLLPHLNALRKCSALEMSRGVLSEQKGDIDAVIESIHAILQFSESLDSEPDLVSALVQHRIEFHAQELLRWLLAHRQVSPQQLAELQQMFGQPKRDNRMERALVSERCFVLATFDYSPGQILDAIDPGYQDRLSAVLGLQVLRFTGTLKRDELRYLDYIEECRDALELALPDCLFHVEVLRESITQRARPQKLILTGMLLPPLLKGIEQNGVGIARRNLVETALALEQYRLASGRLPNSLNELCPNLLPAVPIDPFSKNELLYHCQNESYVIYSVGLIVGMMAGPNSSH